MDEPRAISYALAFVFIGSLGSNVTHIHPSIHPSFYPSIHPSIYPPVYPSYFCLAVYLPPWWRWSLSIFRANLAEMRRHKRNLWGNVGPLSALVAWDNWGWRLSCGPEQLRIQTKQLGHLLVCSLRLLWTTRFACTLPCAHSFACSLTLLTPSLMGE